MAAASTTGNVLAHDGDPNASDSMGLPGLSAGAPLGRMTNNGDGASTCTSKNHFRHLIDGETARKASSDTIQDNHGRSIAAAVKNTRARIRNSSLTEGIPKPGPLRSSANIAAPHETRWEGNADLAAIIW